MLFCMLFLGSHVVLAYCVLANQRISHVCRLKLYQKHKIKIYFFDIIVYILEMIRDNVK